MRILISNDDGYKARGIKVLIKELKNIAQITVVAPSRNRSGASSSLSLDKPIKVTKKEDSLFKLFINSSASCPLLTSYEFYLLFYETVSS